VPSKFNSSQSIFYRRNLPHIHPTDNAFFITFRLAYSLPIRVVIKLKAEFKKQLKFLKNSRNKHNFENKKYKLYIAYFTKFDNMLAQNRAGPQ